MDIKEPLNLNFKEIFFNYTLVSNMLRTLVKTESSTNIEFEIKYDIFDNMLRKHNRWGSGSLFLTFSMMAGYFFQGKSAKLKVLNAFLFMYWNGHIYTLGSHIGILLNLKGAIDQMNLLPDNSQTKILTKLFIEQIKERENLKKENKIYMNDNAIMQSFYKTIMGKNSQEIFNHSYVSNNYFIKNYKQYTKDQKSQNDEKWKVFNSLDSFDYEDSLKLQYFDCFFSRYIYHIFSRWCFRVGQFVGINDE